MGNSLNDLLETLEEHARGAIRFSLSNLDVLRARAESFMKLSIAGACGAAAYAVSLFHGDSTRWLAWAMVLCSVHLCVVSAMLLLGCLKSRDVNSEWFDPEHIHPGLFKTPFEPFALEKFDGDRSGRIVAMQKMINVTRGSARAVAGHFNRAVTALLFVPAWVIVALLCF